jgi:hypothetical protein
LPTKKAGNPSADSQPCLAVGKVDIIESLGELEEPQQTRIHHLTILNRVEVNLMAKFPRITLDIYPTVTHRT